MRKLQTLLAVTLIFVLLLTACAPKAATTAAPAATNTTAPAVPTDTKEAIVAVEATPTTAPTIEAAKFKQAPMLDADVTAGKLPTVDKRLPDVPLVTKPVDSIGVYGGEIQTASWWPQAGNVLLYFATDAPIKWNANLTGYEPALVESYEWSADGKVFTMHMRKGLKWSDGQPYTSADWKFMWEDLALNPDYKGWKPPAYLRNADGTPIDMTFPDDYTVVWTAKDRALWIDPYFMAQGYWEFAQNMMKPAHYLKQYHPKYTPTAKWDDFTKIDQFWITPGYPCLFAWCLESVSADGVNYVFSRNPYFWRVDTEGNQLPYIDKLKVEIVSDDQTRILNCAQGKYDTAFRICGGPNDIPVLQEKASSIGIHFLKGWMNGAGAWPGYMVNQYYVEGGKNYADDTPEHAKEIRDVLRDKRFRQALSLGMDRNRMIDVVWNGIGIAKGETVSPQSWHFASAEGQDWYKKWAASYATFDAATANANLDAMGMKVGADGFRTLPSGKPFVMTVDVSDWGGSLKVQTDSAAEAKKQWETNLKIAVEVKNLQGQPDLDSRTNEGLYMLRGAHISEIDLWTYPDWLFPVVNRYVFPLEGRWFAKGGDKCTDQPSDASKYPCGVKPEGPAATLQALYVKGQNTKTIEDRHKVIYEAIQVYLDQGPFVIGVAGDQAMPIFIKDNIKNVLDFGVVGPWAPATPGNQNPSQWYIQK